MRAGLWSGRTVRWVIGVVVVSFVATSLALGASTRAGEVKATAPAAAPDLSINAVLTAITTAHSFFLKVPGIPGESLNARHANEIDVNTMSWGLSNSPGTATGATFNDVFVTKGLDRATPLLYKASAAGTNVGSVVLTAEKNSGSSVLELSLVLSNAKVRSLQSSGETTNGFTERVTFAFTQLKVTYSYLTNTGTTTPITGCWNLATHVGC